jgi:transketolase
VSTGSLGLGLSVGCGLAHGLRLQGRPSRVYVVLSDAECNEGQVWEAAMFAAHHALSGLVAVVDLNGLQALGNTAEILAVDMARLWSAFGWDTVTVDGHDVEALLAALQPLPGGERPRAIVARTVLGKGVSFMEGLLEWHYRNLTPDLARRALAELEDGG